ncbi:hypothetical protein CYMTET_31301 [Cymbomonas tetramitiformis]|uniref:Aldehyde dehydrogenase domain-containing protein n=1 Tax=Cymbomonas tetramitiformis TaxID=36881 RepID=A0AAE0KTC8_9CHLO|nr:hypothetical protein CYMTET_31301 [Cymbomonas tetramitiformis]
MAIGLSALRQQIWPRASSELFRFVHFSSLARNTKELKMTYQSPKAIGNTVSPDEAIYASKPNVDGAKICIGGVVRQWDGDSLEVTAPIIDASTGKRCVIGRIATLGETEAVEAVSAAVTAWNQGRGEWPQMTMAGRIQAMQKVQEALKEQREAIVNALMWEICKNTSDAAAEFDRTMGFMDASIKTLKELDAKFGGVSVNMPESKYCPNFPPAKVNVSAIGRHAMRPPIDRETPLI